VGEQQSVRGWATAACGANDAAEMAMSDAMANLILDTRTSQFVLAAPESRPSVSART
jgi:hypothetical protein